MGMIGNYVAVKGDTLEKIKSGELDFFDIDPEKCPTLDIDKSWQAIHYMLCKGEIAEGDPPMGYVVPMHSDNLLDVEMDFGAFMITCEQVQEAYEAIKNIYEAQFRAKYDIKSLAEDEVYPVVDADTDDETFFEYLFDYFNQIRDFYKQAIENSQEIIFYIRVYIQ